jgi:hypothetical protein
MVVLIILIVMTASVLRARYSSRKSLGGDGAPLPNAAEVRRMEDEMRGLKERVAVLERIATDRNHLLEQEFESCATGRRTQDDDVTLMISVTAALAAFLVGVLALLRGLERLAGAEAGAARHARCAGHRQRSIPAPGSRLPTSRSGCAPGGDRQRSGGLAHDSVIASGAKQSSRASLRRWIASSLRSSQ